MEGLQSRDRLQETMERLEAGIMEIFDSDRYKNYLDVMSRFHNYSVNNTVLIAMQRPDATRVAGYNNWKDKFHRQVRRGEKGIRIIQPAPYQVKRQMEKVDPRTGKTVTGADGQPVMEEKDITVNAYRVGYVFDISQTDGPELPSMGVRELAGNVEAYPVFFRAVEQASPVPVGFERIPGSSKGFYSHDEKRIAVREGMGGLQNIKTLIHEIAHARLHDRDILKDAGTIIDRRTKEVQAESIAYTVCRHFGLDTSDYSFAYLAGWSSGKELPELRDSLEVIRSTASGLIKEIGENHAVLTNGKSVTGEKEESTADSQPGAVRESPAGLQERERQEPAEQPRERSSVIGRLQGAGRPHPGRERTPRRKENTKTSLIISSRIHMILMPWNKNWLPGQWRG